MSAESTTGIHLRPDCIGSGGYPRSRIGLHAAALSGDFHQKSFRSISRGRP
jgi:hypothetical protein